MDPTKDRTERADRKDPDTEEVPERIDWRDRDFFRLLPVTISALVGTLSSSENKDDGEVGQEASKSADDVLGDNGALLAFENVIEAVVASGILRNMVCLCCCCCPSFGLVPFRIVGGDCPRG